MCCLATRTLLVLVTCVLTTEGQAQQPPEQETTLNYVTFEELPPDTFVGDLKADAALGWSSDVLPQLSFIFLAQGNENVHYFSLEEGGVLRTAQRLDREQLCPPHKLSCEMKLDIAIQPPHFKIIKVKVTVNDQNDNAPAFLETTFTRSVRENSPAGTRLTLPTAEDLDSYQYGVDRYALTSGPTDLFELEYIPDSDGSFEVSLITKQPLDREEDAFHRLVVTAYDKGVPPKSGSLVVDISVQDDNDNSPVFSNNTYEAIVSEDAEINQIILTLSAVDLDEGSNGEVLYQLSARSKRAFGHLFGVNEQTGEMFLKGKLDYEESTEYALTVTAHDNNPDALRDTAKVVVRVEDSNDNAPVITVNALTQSGHVQILESKPPGSFVAHVSVRDPDSGMNGQFSCELQQTGSQPAFRLEALSQTGYKIVTDTLLDRETQAEHVLRFTCRDKGSPRSRSAEQEIVVHVLDQNDNSPRFSKQSYSAIVKENNTIGAVMIQVTAADGDFGPHGQVSYRLHNDAAGQFTIDSRTGVVSAQTVLDYEKAQQVHFRVIASDNGHPPRESTAKVVLSIMDANDEAPQFLASEYVFEVAEGEGVGTKVGTVEAIDRDSAPYNNFVYSMDHESGANELFWVDSQTGHIFTRKTLDRETQSVFQVKVLATDTETPHHSSSIVVSVVVGDSNDNPPVMMFPSHFNNTLHVASSYPVGYLVAKVNARDVDEGVNGALSYFIIEGNENGYFKLDKDSGILSVAEGLGEFSSGKLFVLRIVVRDGGYPPKTAESTLNLVVNQSLEFLPHGGTMTRHMASPNVTIVIAVASCCAVLTAILIAAIVFILLGNRRKQQPQPYHDNTCDKKPGPNQPALVGDGRGPVLYYIEECNNVDTIERLDDSIHKSPKGWGTSYQATNDVKDNVSTHSADVSASDSGHGSHDDRENRPTSVELQLDAGFFNVQTQKDRNGTPVPGLQGNTPRDSIRQKQNCTPQPREAPNRYSSYEICDMYSNNPYRASQRGTGHASVHKHRNHVIPSGYDLHPGYVHVTGNHPCFGSSSNI